MNDTVRKDILDILRVAIEDIRAGNPSSLKELSNHTIHNASIYQDEFSVSIAVIIYSISKIIEKSDEHNVRIAKLLSDAYRMMQRTDLKRYKKATKDIMSLISTVDTKFGQFVDDVISQAQVRKKGGKIYDHGISLGQAAAILGISQWDLMQYAGQIKTQEEYYERPDVIERLKFTRRLFE